MIHCAIRALGQLSHSANSGEDTDSLSYSVGAFSTDSASIADRLQVAVLGNNTNICLTLLISFVTKDILRRIVVYACSFCNTGAPAETAGACSSHAY